MKVRDTALPEPPPLLSLIMIDVSFITIVNAQIKYITYHPMTPAPTTTFLEVLDGKDGREYCPKDRQTVIVGLKTRQCFRQ